MKKEANQEWQNPLMALAEGIVPPTKWQILQKRNLDTSLKKDKGHYDSQSLIGLLAIKNGILCYEDGTYVKILEILPLNYYQKDSIEKNKITESFLHFFRTCPENLHIKTRTEKADIENIIKTIEKTCEKEKNVALKKRAKDYISHIRLLQNANTIEKKFYIFFQYEGEKGKYSRDFSKIYRALKSVELDLRSKLISTGNLVVEPEDENFHACEVLYKFYNPGSYATYPLQNRIDRIYEDYSRYKISPKEKDFIAPRGVLSRATKDWILMDGVYHTFLSIKDNAYPPLVQTGWLDNIPIDLGVDIDIFSRRLNRQNVEGALKQMRKYKYSSYNANKTNLDKAESISKEIKNVEYISSVMGNFDEDLFNVWTVITIRSESLQKMYQMRESIEKHLEGLSIYTATSFLSAHEYLRSVAPDMYVNKSFFKKYGHNLLTRNMAQLYPFTSMSLFDSKGYIVGRNVQGASLVSFDNFNTKRYSNGNIIIMGTPGSGKSFFEMMLGYRMRLMGVRTMFILPLKAHEYKKACERMDGEYISFIPGGTTCINICEIRPQVTISGEVIEETEGMDVPLLARKISSLCAFLQLNMLDDKLSVSEKNRFNVLCTKLYENFGITSDNDSIWLDKKQRILKEMPILQDLNDALKEDPVLYRVKDALSPYMRGGIFSNFNGKTNVDLKNPFQVFDVDKTAISEDYLPAMMYIAFDCCYDQAKQSLYQKDAIFMDEVWLMMQNEDCAKQVKEMVKIIRGYGSCTVLATQDIGDFLRSNNGLGESILAASKIKFFLRIEDMELNNIAKVVDLNANDRANFKRFPPHGRTLLMSDKDKILIDLIASKEEIQTFNTDINLRNQYRRKKQGSS